MSKAKVLLKQVLIASKLLNRHIFTSVRHGGKKLFSDSALLYTNTGLSVGLSVTGDLLQQRYQRLKHDPNRTWDAHRTFCMGSSGLVVGPFVHYWYIYLDRWIPGKGFRVLAKKVFFDQVLFSPVYIVLFLVTIGVLERQTWSVLKQEFRETGVPMYISDLLVWTPAQAINFHFFPPRFRVLFDHCVSLGMDMFYSFLRFDHGSIHESRKLQDGDVTTSEETSSHETQDQADLNNNNFVMRTSNVICNGSGAVDSGNSGKYDFGSDSIVDTVVFGEDISPYTFSHLRCEDNNNLDFHDYASSKPVQTREKCPSEVEEENSICFGETSTSHFKDANSKGMSHFPMDVYEISDNERRHRAPSDKVAKRNVNDFAKFSYRS